MPAPRTCEGQHRAGHQEGARGRCRELRPVRYEGYGPGGVAVIVEALTTTATAPPRMSARCLPSTAATSANPLGRLHVPGWARSSIPLPRPRPMPCWRRRSRRCRRCQLRRVRPHHHLCLRVDRRGVLRLAAKFGDAESVKVVWKPQTLAPVGSGKGRKPDEAVDALDEDDDVQVVFSNADISDEIMASSVTRDLLDFARWCESSASIRACATPAGA